MEISTTGKAVFYIEMGPVGIDDKKCWLQQHTVFHLHSNRGLIQYKDNILPA